MSLRHLDVHRYYGPKAYEQHDQIESGRRNWEMKNEGPPGETSNQTRSSSTSHQEVVRVVLAFDGEIVRRAWAFVQNLPMILGTAVCLWSILSLSLGDFITQQITQSAVRDDKM
ncbi:hypothetical protein DFH28DRAFT_1104661 [Melampsora americana]|nr:hypothetical protein DFH28DRAFT_1104661 [Melampsora americana]